jgi:hypothetical protein
MFYYGEPCGSVDLFIRFCSNCTGSKNLHKKREPAWKLEELRKKRRWAYVHNIVYRYRPYCTAY